MTKTINFPSDCNGIRLKINRYRVEKEFVVCNFTKKKCAASLFDTLEYCILNSYINVILNLLSSIYPNRRGMGKDDNHSSACCYSGRNFCRSKSSSYPRNKVNLSKSVVLLLDAFCF